MQSLTLESFFFLIFFPITSAYFSTKSLWQGLSVVALLHSQETHIQIQPALSEGQEWMKFKKCEGG